MFLVDTNIWLELLLEQDRADEVRDFLKTTPAQHLSITEFSLYSIGVILFRLNKNEIFEQFLSDVLIASPVTRFRLDVADFQQMRLTRQKFRLDFDDLYQYLAAEKDDLTIVSFDSDFDVTPRGRKTPADLLKR